MLGIFGSKCRCIMVLFLRWLFIFRWLLRVCNRLLQMVRLRLSFLVVVLVVKKGLWVWVRVFLENFGLLLCRVRIMLCWFWLVIIYRCCGGVFLVSVLRVLVSRLLRICCKWVLLVWIYSGVFGMLCSSLMFIVCCWLVIIDRVFLIVGCNCMFFGVWCVLWVQVLRWVMIEVMWVVRLLICLRLLWVFLVCWWLSSIWVLLVQLWIVVSGWLSLWLMFVDMVLRVVSLLVWIILFWVCISLCWVCLCLWIFCCNCVLVFFSLWVCFSMCFFNWCLVLVLRVMWFRQ